MPERLRQAVGGPAFDIRAVGAAANHGSQPIDTSELLQIARGLSRIEPDQKPQTAAPSFGVEPAWTPTPQTFEPRFERSTDPPAGAPAPEIVMLPPDLAEALAHVFRHGEPVDAQRTEPPPAPLPHREVYVPPPAPREPTPARPAHDPLPSAISKPVRSEAAEQAEPVWPAIAMTLTLAVAVAIGLLLILGKHSGPAAKTAATARTTPAPVIWGDDNRAGAVTTLRASATPHASSKYERDAVALAQTHIASGELDTARAILEVAATEGGAEARLLLGETYDPNVLAAWGVTQGATDVARARDLYLSALALGDERARRRLQALD
jgi:hypothetical protein